MFWKDLGEKDGMTGLEGPPLDADIVGFDGGSVSTMRGESWRFRQLDAWGKLEGPPAPNVAGGMTMTVPRWGGAGEKDGGSARRWRVSRNDDGAAFGVGQGKKMEVPLDASRLAE